ncbi:family finger-like domain protein [Hydrogenophaga sp. RAC07]|uniref:DUF3426 domain-containing protein n=1 Tax=Hydrogenophaga sp. RAC07 TaxID=1842537 RepID=UPI000857C21B|nr:DUF3426 domain-containing protein [Hydrogenophaga sp. RAC07]AOF85671.1 family finger-like domain protein [Hydrogenophaga sp. RAC07]
MSFTTRCPACGTTFRIVADQLKISEGWVRCGHCADVFDATLYLEPWTPDAPATAGDAPTPGPSDPSPQLTAASDPAEDELVTRPPMPLPDELRAETPEDADFSTELQRFAAAKAAADASVATAKAEATVSRSPSPAAPAPVDEPDDEVAMAPEPEAVPGFVRQARKRAFWQSPGVRIGLSLLVLLLGALLATQWALHERDRLAAWRPDLKPLLEQVCAPLGCRVGPVRNIEAIVIDSSALVRRLGNFHSFDLVLKNTSDMALALPALELSLTDTRDQVISRRVFLPEEWPDAPEVLPAQGSLTVSFRLSLSVGEATPMAGYRALVFYP